MIFRSFPQAATRQRSIPDFFFIARRRKGVSEDFIASVQVAGSFWELAGAFLKLAKQPVKFVGTFDDRHLSASSTMTCSAMNMDSSSSRVCRLPDHVHPHYHSAPR